MTNLKRLNKALFSPSVSGMLFISAVTFTFLCLSPVFSQTCNGIFHLLPKNCPESIICLSSTFLLLVLTLSIGLFAGFALNKHFENQKEISTKLSEIRLNIVNNLKI